MKVEKIIENARGKKVVLMPDFFIDHLLYWRRSLEGLISTVEEVVGRRGGNTPVNQELLLGGCAAKTAWVMSLLGTRPTLLSRTSAVGLKLLDHFLGGRVDLSRVKTDGELALTLALETAEANIMFNSRGAVEEFNWQTIAEDEELLREADAVGIFSWNHMERGTELAQKVFSETTGLKFLDTGDPTLKSREKGRELLEKVKPDVWSMNENEVKYFSSFFKPTDDRREAADILWENGIKAVLHTRDYAYSPKGMVPSFKVAVKRATGAGDSWNAGYIVGRISGLGPEECLTLANAVAGCWVSSQEITPANIANILEQKR